MREITNYFTRNEYLHHHNTRSASNIHLDYKRTNHGKFSIKYRGAQIWNNLPQNLRNQKVTDCLKNMQRFTY